MSDGPFHGLTYAAGDSGTSVGPSATPYRTTALRAFTTPWP